jgi:hypothetical protein
MSRKTVDKECAACDARKSVPDSGEAYLSGVVLGAANGDAFLEWERKSLCPYHVRKLEKYLKAMKEEMS